MTHASKNKPLLLVTSGDPAGIGPDICLQLAMHTECSDCVFLGDHDVFTIRATMLGIALPIVLLATLDEYAYVPKNALKILHVPCPVSVVAGVPDSGYADYVLQQLAFAAEACQMNRAHAMITCPVSKQYIQAAGYGFIGHTEWLANRFGVQQVVMSFISKALRVALATTHVPLTEVSQSITTEKLLAVIEIVAESMQTLFDQQSLRQQKSRLCVLGLNPHAGEGGSIGSEEQQCIAPAVQQAQARGLDVFGPVAADSFFLDARYTNDTFVIAMYHDQILPLIKYTDFSGSVNMTLGLPVVRTSVDHGTAFGLAGTGASSPVNLQSAVELARRVVSTQ